MIIKPHIAKGPTIAVQAKENLVKQEAERAVARFEESYGELTEMRQDFQQRFPEAHVAMQSILRQEDTVRENIKTAHSLVQAVKESIGPFSCVRKWSSAGYDDSVLTVILRQLENRADIMQGLLDNGIVDRVVLSDKATAFFAQNPEYARLIQPAWRDKIEKTAAVTDPKI
jgi:hypothetical protein